MLPRDGMGVGRGLLWPSQQTQALRWSGPLHLIHSLFLSTALSCFAPEWAIGFILGPLWKEMVKLSLSFQSYASCSCGSSTCGPALMFLAAYSLTSDL